MNKKKDKVGEEEAVKNDELPAVDPIPPQIPLEANAEEYKNPASISKARRRLSVDGDEAYLDGVGEIDMDIEAPVNDHPEDDVFVGIFAGKSQKGYVPVQSSQSESGLDAHQGGRCHRNSGSGNV